MVIDVKVESFEGPDPWNYVHYLRFIEEDGVDTRIIVQDSQTGRLREVSVTDFAGTSDDHRITVRDPEMVTHFRTIIRQGLTLRWRDDIYPSVAAHELPFKKIIPLPRRRSPLFLARNERFYFLVTQNFWGKPRRLYHPNSRVVPEDKLLYVGTDLSELKLVRDTRFLTMYSVDTELLVGASDIGSLVLPYEHFNSALACFTPNGTTVDPFKTTNDHFRLEMLDIRRYRFPAEPRMRKNGDAPVYGILAKRLVEY